jgi:hypothetical protein
MSKTWPNGPSMRPANFLSRNTMMPPPAAAIRSPRRAPAHPNAAEIFDGEPGFFGKAVGRQTISVAPRRRRADFHQALLDAALEVGVDESEGDPEFRGQTPLRLPAVALDRLQQFQHDALVVLVLDGIGHLPPPIDR